MRALAHLYEDLFHMLVVRIGLEEFSGSDFEENERLHHTLNMAYSKTDWMVVRAFFERGLSLAEITQRPEVKIKDRGSISRKAKQEAWIKNGKATLVIQEVQVKQAVAMMAQQKATLDVIEAKIHDTLVEERTKHIGFFNDAAILNVQQALLAQCENQDDYKARAETICRARDVVLGKGTDTRTPNNINPKFTKIERVIVKKGM